MIVLLVKRGGGEIWQSISGKPNVQTNFFWKPLGVIIHRQKALDEPSSVLQLSNLSMSKITSSPRFRNLCTTPLCKVLYKVVKHFKRHNSVAKVEFIYKQAYPWQ